MVFKVLKPLVHEQITNREMPQKLIPSTSNMNSNDNFAKISLGVAPITFLIPISFVFFSAFIIDIPKIPSKAINSVRLENSIKVFPNGNLHYTIHLSNRSEKYIQMVYLLQIHSRYL
jgi:uncharacterized protein YcsI (UPF0317 family)